MEVSGVRNSCDASPTKRRKPTFGRGARRERSLDLLHHLVQRDAEPADFGVLVDDVDAPGEITRGDCAGRLLHVLQRPQAELDDPPRHDGEDEAAPPA